MGGTLYLGRGRLGKRKCLKKETAAGRRSFDSGPAFCPCQLRSGQSPEAHRVKLETKEGPRIRSLRGTPGLAVLRVGIILGFRGSCTRANRAQRTWLVVRRYHPELPAADRRESLQGAEITWAVRAWLLC